MVSMKRLLTKLMTRLVMPSQSRRAAEFLVAGIAVERLAQMHGFLVQIPLWFEVELLAAVSAVELRVLVILHVTLEMILGRESLLADFARDALLGDSLVRPIVVDLQLPLEHEALVAVLVAAPERLVALVDVPNVILQLMLQRVGLAAKRAHEVLHQRVLQLLVHLETAGGRYHRCAARHVAWKVLPRPQRQVVDLEVPAQLVPAVRLERTFVAAELHQFEVEFLDVEREPVVALLDLRAVRADP